MSKCVLGYFLTTIEGEEIKAAVQYAYDLLATHIEKLTTISQEEQTPTPTGFTYDDDVNLNTPRLYTDPFMLIYINHVAKIASMSARDDIRAYYREGLTETSKLFELSSKVLLSKGLFKEHLI